MPALKLITLNVEMNRHWADIIPFIERESPDVLCLQELFERDAKMLAKRFGYDYVINPISSRTYDPDAGSTLNGEGVAILTKLPLQNKNKAFYYQAPSNRQLVRAATPKEKRATISQGVVWGTVLKDGTEFNIATTQFTWTPDGQPNQYQDEDIKSLLKILDGIPDMVLCGDFNAPRGANRIYQTLTERFKDNIPPEVKSTLDLTRHRVGKDPVEGARIATYVVDYIFSTPEYAVKNVRTQFDVSDHCAIIADVTREK